MPIPLLDPLGEALERLIAAPPPETQRPEAPEKTDEEPDEQQLGQEATQRRLDALDQAVAEHITPKICELVATLEAGDAAAVPADALGDWLEAEAPDTADLVRSTLEVVLREALLRAAQRPAGPVVPKKRGAKAMDDDDAPENAKMDLPRVFRALDTAFVLGRRKLVDPLLVLLLAEATIDAVPTAAAEDLFGYLEERQTAFERSAMPPKTRSLALLRLCNELRRRLSKTQNTVFDGRIMMFVANAHALSDKSGVNLRGEFNLGNETLFDPNTRLPDRALGELYRAVWGLQAYFREPLALVRGPEHEAALRSFTAHVELLLKGVSRWEERESADSGTPMRVAGPLDGDADVFFPKYLTSPKLFELQMHDASFRQQLLMQLAITLRFTASFLPAAAAERAGTAGNRAVAFPFELQAQYEPWFAEAQGRVDRMLAATPALRESAKLVLERDELWCRWKARGCPPFEKRLDVPLAAAPLPAWQPAAGIPAIPAAAGKALGGPDMGAIRRVAAVTGSLAERLQARGAALRAAADLAAMQAQWNADHPVDSDGRPMAEFATEWTDVQNWHALRTAVAERLDLVRKPDTVDLVPGLFAAFSAA